jgi:hypothetical protein
MGVNSSYGAKKIWVDVFINGEFMKTINSFKNTNICASISDGNLMACVPGSSLDTDPHSSVPIYLRSIYFTVFFILNINFCNK